MAAVSASAGVVGKVVQSVESQVYVGVSQTAFVHAHTACAVLGANPSLQINEQVEPPGVLAQPAAGIAPASAWAGKGSGRTEHVEGRH